MSLDKKTAPERLAVTALFCALSTVAVAQDSGNELEDVIVTASIIEKPVNEITHSVTVIDEKKIEEQGFTDMTEILRQQAGVEFKQVGGPGQFNYLKLRGLGAANVLVIVDGVKLNTASGGDTRNLLSQLDPDSIESLEIVRGPQATLYGANSTAGVIVIKTKSGKRAHASLGAEVGSLSWRKLTGSLRDGAKLRGGDLFYSLNLSKTDSDNIHQYEYFKDRSGQLKLSYETDRWSVGGNVWKVKNDFGYAELDEASCCQNAATYWSFQTPDPDQHSETGETVASAFTDFKFTDNLKQTLRAGSTKTSYSIIDTANGLLGYQRATVTIPANATGNSTAVPAGSPVPIYDTATGSRAFYADERKQAEYDLVFTGRSFNLLGGIEYQKQRAQQWGSYGSSDTDDSQLSYLANGDLKLLSDDFILSLGLRLDDYESWGGETTGNVGIAWQVAGPVNLYANYGTSFKPATMAQLFNPTYGDSSLKPETGRTAELGVRTRFLDDALSMEASYWNTHIDSVIFFDYSIVNPRRSTGFGQYNNGSEGKTSGLEFQTHYQLSDRIGVYGNYTYTDSQTKAVGADWLRSVQIAYHKANAGANYKANDLTLGTNVYYSGPRLRWAGDLETRGYVRVDVSGRYQLNQALSLSARVENLLNDDYLDELGYAETGLYAIFGIEYRFF